MFASFVFFLILLYMYRALMFIVYIIVFNVIVLTHLLRAELCVCKR